ncbi:MAG TPA: aspartate kinase [Peptostreptococcaceae bacterium]|nr:aspartate kinase [Peptostreptococcaceae bacterium]
MNIIVQKFGGTSVQSVERMNMVSDIIQNYKNDGYDIVIVVSAMGRKGDPYATDTLVGLCENVNEDLLRRELDMIMHCGEVISGSIFVNLLKSKGIDAVFLNGGQAGIITNGIYGDSRIIDIRPDRIFKELSEGKVVVVAGFQGITEDGEITTLGRGGSDTSAVAVGKALNCDVVEIYTDVDGIMTADPRIQPSAKVLKNINYDEVFQMADKGAKVIHPRAVDIAKSGNITIKVKNTMNLEHEGTIISGIRPKFENGITYEESSLVTSIAHQTGFTQVIIRKYEEEDFIGILNEIEKNNVTIDMINFFIKEKAFIIDAVNTKIVNIILEKYDIEYEITQQCSKVTIIGSKISYVPGVMARIVKILSSNNIKLLQTSDSEMTISCLVKESDMIKAVNYLHDTFEL